MSRRCEDCGCTMSGGACPNCHEETFIMDQYNELGMEPPTTDTDFGKKYAEQQPIIEKNRKKIREDDLNAPHGDFCICDYCMEQQLLKDEEAGHIQ